MIDEQEMSGEKIVQLSREFTWFSWSVQSAVRPIPITRAEGVYFWDADGKKYLDFSSQLVNVNIGHQHPKVVRAIKDQADRLCTAHPGMATEPRGILGRMLAEVAPGDLNKVFLCLGGAEANENAIKIARMYTGRHKIISRYRSYHGGTHGALTLTGDHRRWSVEPAMPGIVHVLDPYCYRCPFGWTITTCHRECIAHLEEVILYEGPDHVAALFFEGVTGTNGVIIPPDDYWPRAREICDKYGILLISDEVMSGFGRTGKWFAVNNWNVVPDIMTLAKGLTSGYVPLGGMMVSDRIARSFEDKMLWCGLTYNSHPLACAAAIATLRVYQEEGLIENAARVGLSLGRGLEKLKKGHPSVGDVRYIGLFSVIELVKSKVTREPLIPRNPGDGEKKPMRDIANFLQEQGLFAFVQPNLIIIAPPLCITGDKIEEGLEIMDRALRISDAAGNVRNAV